MLASTRKRFEELESDLDRLTRSVDKLVSTNRPGSIVYSYRMAPMWMQMADAVERGRKALSQPGTRVSYRGEGNTHRWTGTVVAQPCGARHIGNTGEPFIYVVKDGMEYALGCYASRLVRV